MKLTHGEMLFEIDQRRDAFVKEIKSIVKRRHRFRVDFAIQRFQGSLTRLLKIYWGVEEKEKK